MGKKYFTIGMAGHIDHGKTSLTKALTNIDTDRLKEEKERQISIEPGFAPLYEDEDLEVSVIDVPGHERFIRQMIAGVAGIDLVILVVAADEGVMPQTKEHLQILGFLGIEKGIVVISKADRVDEEFIGLVEEEILLELEGTVFEGSPSVLVDSLSLRGIEELKVLIEDELKEITPRGTTGAFRLPIDQAFSVKGQGTVVRGTVYEGSVEEGQQLKILPSGIETRARQIQVHRKQAEKAFAGQRTAINLSGVAKEDAARGQVLVSADSFTVTNVFDASIRTAEGLESAIKQRMPVKCHIGTAEVMGRIVFFDRNELKEDKEEILCQIRLDEEVVTKRGDRFILRRPSPAETIGGGWVIDPHGRKYKFGKHTVELLDKKKQGSPHERISDALRINSSMKPSELAHLTGVDEETVLQVLQEDGFVKIGPNDFAHSETVQSASMEAAGKLGEFHSAFPMRKGILKAELVQSLAGTYGKSLVDFTVEKGILDGKWIKEEQWLFSSTFERNIPKSWQKRAGNMLDQLSEDGLQVQYLDDYFAKSGIPGDLKPDMIRFLTDTDKIVPIDGQYYYHADIFNEAVEKLKAGTGGSFDVGVAKDLLGLSRKYIIPLLERLDELKLTVREDNKRIWKK
ncbi:selenocysteine-specific translation elongation factor [Bacillus infantis]|uniref:Selenocysteine-specific elongation factor n=1 Tax=Bacillus infantis TaxID=324767 RepID=A0A5D4STP2_9BACI|nr:selenocysteine-specific translation elongation factor [Bacillus infantis]TYS65474.1 selenocysteine-specific translation elongation factor [Bacillus infantis]